MRRRALLRGGFGAACVAVTGAHAEAAGAREAAAAARGAAAALPAVLREPAVMSPLAPRAALLAAARAGERVLVAGERGIVLFSDDGGRTWSQARVPVQASLTALRFADARRGWACGHLGTLLSTTDAGTTWTLELDGVRAARLALDAPADEAARTHAQRLLDEGPDKPLFDIELLNSSAIAVGAYGLAFEKPDGGAWRSRLQRLPNPRRLHLYAVRRIGERVLIAGEQGLLLRSNDGGARFEALASPYKGSFFGLLAARSGTVIAFGLRGHAFRSTDAGSTWTPVATGAPVALSAGIERADGTLLLLAQNGDLLISRDDGKSFERRAAERPMPAAALAAADGRALVLAGLRGVQRMEPA